MQRALSLPSRQPQAENTHLETESILRWYVRRWNKRLRLKHTLEWLPRGVMVGLVISIALGLLSRLRDWFSPEEAIQIAGGILGAMVLVSLGVAWTLERPAVISRSQSLFHSFSAFLRGLLFGVPAAVLIGIFLGVRPRLLPEELVSVSVSITVVCATLTFLAIWWIPRPLERSARYFDRRFALNERVSTALELLRGKVNASARLFEHQIEDTRVAANRVSLREVLPLRLNRFEVMLLIALIGALLTGFIIENPFSQQLKESRALSAKIEEQAQVTEEIQEAIAEDPNLTPEEKEELLAPLEQAERTLDQEDISRAEAVAALTEAEQEMREMSDGLSEQEREANSRAGQELSRSSLTDELGQELRENDLSGAAQELREMASELSEMSQEELNEMADQLERAAEELEATNPALADLLRQAAEALREGNVTEAQQLLEQAAALMEQQEQINQENPQAQAAREAAERLEESRRELSDLEQGAESQPQEQQGEQGTSGQPQTSASQSQGQTQEQTGESQQGEGQQQQGEGQQPSSQQGEGQPQQGEGQPGESQQSESQQGTGQSQQGEGQQQGGQPGEGQTQTGEGQPNGEQQSGTAQGQTEQGAPGSSGAGEGSSPQGNDTTGTQSSDSAGDATNSPGDDEMRDFDSVFAPQRIGDDGGDNVERIEGQVSDENGEPLQPGEFNEEFQGESLVPYNEVYREYEDAIQEALKSDYIPIGLRDLIRVYFSSLEP